MGTDKKRLNLTLSNGLLITHAQRHKNGGVYVLFITDLQITDRLIFDGKQVVGKHTLNLSSGDIGLIDAAVKKAFA